MPITAENKQGRERPFAQLRRHPQVQPVDEHNRWVTMPQDEFDREVNTLQNFDEEPLKPNTRERVEAAVLVAVPFAIALLHAIRN